MLRKSFIGALFVFSFTAIAAPSRGGGNFQSNILNAKRSQKEASQWTLMDWLDQKKKMRLADQWLAMNRSATLFETVGGGGHNRYTLKSTDAVGVSTEVDRDSQVYNLDLYISIFNFYGEFEKTSDRREAFGGAAGLRLLGTSSQTTSLVARYGWRKLRDLSSREVWENQFAEGLLQLYIFKYFGLSGKYRHYFPNESNLGNRLSGTKASVGAFIEFMIFRLFGEVYQEPIEFTDAAGVKTKEERRGYQAGFKIYL